MRPAYAAADMATADATASSHMVTGLMAGTSYTFQVRGTNAEGDSYWSMYAMAMRDAAVTELTAPSDVMAMSDAAGELKLTWEGADDAELYVLLAVDLSSLDSGTVEYEKMTITDGAARMGTFSGLTSDTRYLGIVVAVKGMGDDIEVLHETAPVVTVQ